jgi:hypothetical protein
MAGTTRLELATSAVTGQRSNQLNYVPTNTDRPAKLGVCSVQFELLSQNIRFFSKHDSRKYNLPSPRLATRRTSLLIFSGGVGTVDHSVKLRYQESHRQRRKKCAIHRQIGANTITASTTIRRRSSNSPRRSLIHIRQSGQGNLNTPIYDPYTSREICGAEIQSEAYV